MSTSIEWTDETWNPLVGCSKVGPGCDHCYAIGVVHRAMSPQHVGLTVKPEGAPVDWTGEVRPVPHRLDLPLRWKRPRRVFVNSLSDVFHTDVSGQYIAEVFAVMALAPHHTFQVLTKRPQRMASLLSSSTFWLAVAQAMITRTNSHRGNPIVVSTASALPNVWLGTSIENDTYTWRANILRSTPAAVRFISAEPLLGPLPSLDLTGIDWVISGGESGPAARPMHPDWVRDLRDQCAVDSVQFLFKQWGSWKPVDDGTLTQAEAVRAIVLEEDGLISPALHAAMGDPGQLMLPMSKNAAGRTLDGRTWDEFPAPRRTA